MNSLPRWYYAIKVFNNFYNSFCEQICNYNSENIQNYHEIKPYFDIIKICFEFYHKPLKYLLRDRGYNLYFPTQILEIAEKEGLINDAKIWLEYIEDLNVFYQTYGNEKLLELAKNIIDKYKNKLSDVHKTLNEFKAAIHPTEKKSENKQFPKDISAEILASDLGIMKHSYDLIMEYFKSNKNIKYVWLHGSRAKGNAKKNSDVDLVIDIEPDKITDCKNDFYNLAIPYRVDCVSVNESSVQEFLNEVVDNAKLIYKAI